MLTSCNEGEEKNLGPDFINNGGLEFFEGDPPLKKGIRGDHNVSGKRKDHKFWFKKCWSVDSLLPIVTEWWYI